MILTLDQLNVLHRAGRFEEAERGYRDYLKQKPRTLQAQYGLGVVLLQSGKAREALTYLSLAAEQNSSEPNILNALGAAQLQVGDAVDALNSFKAVLEIKPDSIQTLSNVGVIYHRLNDPAASVKVLQRAVELDPENGDTLYNLGRALRGVGRYADAEEVSVRALTRLSKSGASQTQIADAHYNLAEILLKSGRLAEGWAEYNWRLLTSDYKAAEVFKNITTWNGEPLSDGTLLVWTEQGPGDEILYASMIADLEDIAPQVVVACTPRLVGLFARSFSFAHVVSHEDLKLDESQPSEFTAQIAAGSLGQFVRPNFESFPQREVFLTADLSKVKSLKKRYRDQSPGTPVIGLSWRSGNPQYGESKSLALGDLARTLGQTDATLVDLQYGDTAEERAAAALDGFALYKDEQIDPLVDLDGFAAQVAAMDLVITVSNTTAHFAGALGVPCLTLLPAGSGQFWYWFLDRKDSPWYPSLRLFRQSVPGDWTDVLSDLHVALSEWQPK